VLVVIDVIVVVPLDDVVVRGLIVEQAEVDVVVEVIVVVPEERDVVDVNGAIVVVP
jgi:hypothetical protein